jgi:bifunctional NMN adenylyltransferase/nudix hydrolase
LVAQRPALTLQPDTEVPSYDLAVILSAFEPVHLAHCVALERAADSARQVLALIGSAGAARTLRHPWTAGERAAMLQEAAASLRMTPPLLVTVADRLYDDDGWRRVVGEAVAQAVPQSRSIAQVQVRGAPGGAALPGWTLLTATGPESPDFWTVRRGVFSDARDARERLDAALPASTRQSIDRYRTQPDFAALGDELRYIEKFRESWRRAPYPPILVTTDAVVLHGDCILLVRRGRAPGKGLWALPGGFVDQDETLLEACVRELREETGLDLAPPMRDALLCGQRIFDAPHRSLRGRTITHAFRFDLDAPARPAVAGGDDAADAQWIPLERLARMETQVFEDHYHIVRSMLN